MKILKGLLISVLALFLGCGVFHTSELGEKYVAIVKEQNFEIEVLMPVVKVSANLAPKIGQYGTGVIIYSEQNQNERYTTYVLTCNHIIEFATVTGEKVHYISHIEFYDRFTNKILEVPAKLVAYSAKEDLALLELDTKWAFPSAKLLSPESLWRLRVDGKVLVVGCALGGLATHTRGSITTLFNDYMEVNAPVYKGVSGGACYLDNTNTVIGIVSTLRADPGNRALVPHLAGVVPIYKIYKWLDKIGYRFLYDEI